MARLYLLFFVLNVLLLVLALISCLSAEKGEIRTLPRFVWFLAIVLLPLVGAVAYFIAGRPLRTATHRDPHRPGAGFGLLGSHTAGTNPGRAVRPRRTLAPDDDPDFLRTLGNRDTASRPGDSQDDDGPGNHADDLRQWEEDLNRRDKDMRGRDDTPSNGG